MKVPYSWLLEFVDPGRSPEEIAEKLTISGVEVETLQGVGALDPKVVVGEVRALEALSKVPGVQTLVVLADRERRIVSNAQGLAVGKRIAVALPGATLFGGPELDLVEVEESEVYGQPSEGVVVHAQNLGLGRDVEKPIELPGAPPGAEVAPLLGGVGAADRVLWLAILPNIARCQAMIGVARELSALFDVPLKARPEVPAFSAERTLSSSISDPDVASALTLTLIENVRVGPSPEWLLRRLVLGGMTPINNVVDASNYVMLELGQPTHPYDADKLPRLELGVRRARIGDRLLTLQQPEDAEPLPIPEGVPVITSNDAPVALAGVLGGRPTSITDATTRVLLESASFDYVAIRKSQRLAKVYSEASARFSRGVNPELPLIAARRFVEVLKESSPGLQVTGFGETSLGVPPERRLTLTRAELVDSLGTEVTLEQARTALERLGIEVTSQGSDALLVTVGNARPDLTLARDLVEEVARVHGYESIAETLPRDPIPERLHEDHRPRVALRDALVGAGLQEIITYSLNGPDVEARLYASHPGAERPTPVPLVNPVSVERSVLRTSLLPGLIQTAALNLRHEEGARLFEIGTIFLPAEPVPTEIERAGIVLAGLTQPATLHDKEPRELDFFDLKAIVLELVASAGIESGVSFAAIDRAPLRPGAAATLSVNGEVAGALGAVHPRVLEAFGLEGSSVLVAELDVSKLSGEARKRRQFRDFDRLPSIELDVALVVDKKVTAERVREVIRDAGGPWLRAVDVFDQFFSAQFGDDKKALAVRLRLNAGERTLEMTEALEVRARAARALERALGAQIRE